MSSYCYCFILDMSLYHHIDGKLFAYILHASIINVDLFVAIIRTHPSGKPQNVSDAINNVHFVPKQTVKSPDHSNE